MIVGRGIGLVAVLVSVCIAGCDSTLQPAPLPKLHPTGYACAASYGESCVPEAPTASASLVEWVTTLNSLAFSDANNGWAVGSRCHAACAVLVSTTGNGGKTWSPPSVIGGPSPSQQGGQTVAVQIRVVRAHVWVFGPGVFESTDRGKSWQKTFSAPVVALEPYGDTVWAVEGCSDVCQPRLLTGEVGKEGWRVAAVQPPLAAESFEPLPMSPQVLLERSVSGVSFLTGAASDGSQVLLSSRDVGHSWSTLRPPCSDIVGVRSVTRSSVWVLCATPCCTGNWVKELYSSDNGGVSWTARAASGYKTLGYIPFPGTAEALVVTPSQVGFFGASEAGGIWRSSDHGVRWTSVFVDECIQGGAGVSDLWFVNDTDGWAVSQTSDAARCPSLLRTTDGGTTWTSLPDPFSAA